MCPPSGEARKGGGAHARRAAARRRDGRQARPRPAHRQLVHDPQLKGLAFVLRERFQALRKHRPGREPFLDRRVSVLRGQVGREAEPAACPGLHLVPAGGLAGDIPRNAEEPPECRSFGWSRNLRRRARPGRTSQRSDRLRPNRSGGGTMRTPSGRADGRALRTRRRRPSPHARAPRPFGRSNVPHLLMDDRRRVVSAHAHGVREISFDPQLGTPRTRA